MSNLIEVPELVFLHPQGNGVRILSLDGGDARCFSQLSILAELMHRLEYDHGRPVRPCEFFHSITGVGASGVIAILFGVLCMTVDEASTAFIGICEKVFAPNVSNEVVRSEILGAKLEKILEGLNLPSDSRLAGNLARNPGCRVSVCHSAAAIQGCRTFRNYISTQHSYNPTIVEAARSSWATPGLFSSILVGPPLFAEELTSAVNGFNNPTLQAAQEVRALYGADRAVSTFLSLGSGRRGPVSVYSSDSFRRTAQQTDTTEEDIERELGLSGVYYRFSPEYTIEGDTFSVESNQFGSIMSYTRAYLDGVKTRRAMEIYLKASAQTSTIDLRFKADGEIPISFGPSSGVLSVSLDLAAQDIPTHTYQVPKTARLSREERSLLQTLSIQGLDCGSPLQGCMSGTRESILQRINEWTTNFQAPNIIWIKGHPGVGKTAIATEMVEQLTAVRRLGSSFFFRRQEAASLTPHALWRTVAHDLARKHPTIRSTVIAKLEEDEVAPTTVNLDNLFRHFVRDPLLGSGKIPNERMPVIVIDALDECGGLDGQHSEHRKSLLTTLRDWSLLPTKFKLILTSRGENDLDHMFSKIRHNLIQITAGETVDARSSDDIRVFLSTKLQEITPRYPSLPPNWPGTEKLKKLVDTAGGLFIWAQTALKFIQSGEPQDRLDHVLDGRVSGDIDDLYKKILTNSFRGSAAEALNEYVNFRSVVGTIILVKGPLSLLSLASLLSIKASSVEHVCTGLQSVLEYQSTLRFHHQSFVDFLLNPSKCPSEFLIEPNSASRHITLACFRVMKVKLHFNMCDIQSSYVRNTDIPDLQIKIDENIQPDLLYSSCWWASHLALTSFDADILGYLRYFMREQFLYWLELLSVTKRVNQGSQTLQLLVDWISFPGEENISEMARDMQKFFDTFAPVISQSAPHIYLSALPFAPSSSAISRLYMPQYPQTFQVATGGLGAWPAIQNALTGHGDCVGSVAFSPDGRRVVSGSDDKTVRIWDAATGETILGPLEGHSSEVYSVAFSPDERRVVSGSGDETIRIWDVATGETVVGPLKGHSDWIRSVAFSPDGRHVISGSDDMTIRIWDAETGGTVLGPLEGHGMYVSATAFSPDGKRIVSGSYDKTVRIWDAATGETILGPLEGHSGKVYSVAFSPDGRRIISGSEDHTIRIWDATMGGMIGSPLQGHNSVVTSVAFSPDGSRIASCSHDGMIRIWDATAGGQIVAVLDGHGRYFKSVAFSPDGRRIVSGAIDETIQIWDATTGEAVVEALEGHGSEVTSVAFSPDGRNIVSGSSDRMVQIWDATTGEMVLGPLEGHSSGVSSVSFSPDGRRIISGSDDMTIRIWDATTGEIVVGPLAGHSSEISSVAFSPDGRRGVSGSWDNTIRIWDVATGETVVGPLKGHSSDVYSVAFSPDGRCVISGSDDETIRIWDATTGEKVAGSLECNGGGVWSVSFSPDGRHIVSGSSDHKIYVWDVTTRKMVLGPLEGHSGGVDSVAFSPDGRYLVSGSSDKTIRIWDAMTGETVVGPLHGHINIVTSVAFLPDARCVVSGSFDRSIRVWDAKIGNMIAGPLEGHGNDTESPKFLKVGRSNVPGDEETTLQEANTGFHDLKDQSCPFFNESTPMRDGWLLGSKSELMIWVPPTLQIGLWRPGTKLFIGKFVQTRLNFDSFVHGTSWTLCKAPTPRHR